MLGAAAVFIGVGQGIAYLCDAGGKMHLLAFLISCIAYMLAIALLIVAAPKETPE